MREKGNHVSRLHYSNRNFKKQSKKNIGEAPEQKYIMSDRNKAWNGHQVSIRSHESRQTTDSVGFGGGCLEASSSALPSTSLVRIEDAWCCLSLSAGEWNYGGRRRDVRSRGVDWRDPGGGPRAGAVWLVMVRWESTCEWAAAASSWEWEGKKKPKVTAHTQYILFRTWAKIYSLGFFASLLLLLAVVHPSDAR